MNCNALVSSYGALNVSSLLWSMGGNRTESDLSRTEIITNDYGFLSKWNSIKVNHSNLSIPC